ncbi:MAG TPA: hypothetical protein VJ438_00410 [Candidatus Nanoarchaeia archaeon]|nr:hypothetical protein [Candidatus Nanoarchaeia archaeon]
MPRGKTFVLEGTDKSGKNTQSDYLLASIRALGLNCQKMSFPRYHTPTGRIVGQCYLGKILGPGDRAWFGDANLVPPEVASIYYAADRLAAVPEIEEILSSRSHLILDRWVESNMGHQGGKAKTPEQRAGIIEFISHLEYGVLDLPKPDAVIFLYMPYEVARTLPRAEAADGHESNEEHLRNAEETYLYLAKRFNWKQINCAPNGKIRSIDDIHQEVFEIVKPYLSL